jgi:hypothetical protein
MNIIENSEVRMIATVKKAARVIGLSSINRTCKALLELSLSLFDYSIEKYPDEIKVDVIKKIASIEIELELLKEAIVNKDYRANEIYRRSKISALDYLSRKIVEVEVKKYATKNTTGGKIHKHQNR